MENREIVWDDMMGKACQWAEALQSMLIRQGRPLEKKEMRWASNLGVCYPEKIRILEVTEFPKPETADLSQLANQLGLYGPGLKGLTLGYLILTRSGQTSLHLLKHELIHVRQFERCGSIAAFIKEYLKQIQEHGYEHAPWELEANRQFATQLNQH